MSDTPTIRRAQFRGVTLSRDDLVEEARKYMGANTRLTELGDWPDLMADFAMMIAARVALRMTLPPGYVVVPREPTMEMLQDGYDAGRAVYRNGISGMTIDAQTRAQSYREAAIYRAIIAAATKESEG